MAQRLLKFAIFGNEYQIKKAIPIQKVLSYLSEKQAEVYMDRMFYDFLTQEQRLEMEIAGVFDGMDFQADYAISMGGDGTFLKAASRVGAKQIPIIGVNMGRMGFLADVLPSEIESALNSIYLGEYKIENHTVIQVEANGEPITGYPYASTISPC